MLKRFTIRNKYAFPVISKLLEKIRDGKWFTQLDLKNGYNLIRVGSGHEWNTAFHTKEGLFACTVIPFVLTNARTTFREMMDTICIDEKCCVWYMYDILIYCAETTAEHQAYVQKTVQQCVNHGLAVYLTKSEFYIHETIFLGHIVNGSQVQMDPAKLKSMFKWPVPTKKKEVQAFLGFANYYCRFIENYTTKARHSIDLTNDVPFSYGHTQN